MLRYTLVVLMSIFFLDYLLHDLVKVVSETNASRINKYHAKIFTISLI